MSEAIPDWDGWLNRLVEEQTARKEGDTRSYLIAEISRAMSQGNALRVTDPEQLAKIAVDVMIECTRKIRPS